VGFGYLPADLYQLTGDNPEAAFFQPAQNLSNDPPLKYSRFE
jgi:hypothetical protein